MEWREGEMTSPTPIHRGADLDPRRSGFTLIELLVVLALLGVLSGLVVPRFGGTTRALQVEEAARRLHSELQRCRVDAMRNATRIEVEFSARGVPELVANTFAAPPRAAWDFVPVTEALRRTSARSSSVRFEFEGRFEAEPRRIVFHADGTSTESSIRISGASGRAYSVIVRPQRVLLEEVVGGRS